MAPPGDPHTYMKAERRETPDNEHRKPVTPLPRAGMDISGIEAETLPTMTTIPHTLVICPLIACRAGDRATVRGLHCALADADRLRILGVYEGACVAIVDRRNGILLDVCGSRLALDAAIARTIQVEPTAA